MKIQVIPAPNPNSLKRCWPWQTYPAPLPDVQKLAHHEAGHIVMFEWLGFSESNATITPTGGLAYFGTNPGRATVGPLDESSEITAMAASLFHGGVIAELIFAGGVWTGPLFYPWASDYQRANDMLRADFGNHSSAGHAFAQRTALNILSERWPRVHEIAKHLVRHGVWPASTL
ncbi:hypothetical protein [Rhodoferax sp.]|uniref:hypothetical protein n=1 Tax=Rhodoferax sp. TaxID=50421 RepID=UPI00261C1630|nr:hypothetical protein [Rhodoferax sp.]MDD2917437.1 hypothetical protein [Rhodoferax sp.]